MNSIAFIDSEISTDGKKILDLGAIKPNKDNFHGGNVNDFMTFISDCEYICGHNIVNHDYKYLEKYFNADTKPILIDTLYISPLVFPKKPYHALLKDDKLESDELNNPLNDATKSMNLFYDEISAYESLEFYVKWIYSSLLSQIPEFEGFFKYKKAGDLPPLETVIKKEFVNKICENAPISEIIKNNPIELAYALAIILSDDQHSITPPWVLKNFPLVENVIKILRNTACDKGCPYCTGKLDVNKGLKEFFGYDNFRTYNGEPLQEMAAKAAVDNKSLLAVFPTGGGKSITFQLPALMAGEAVHGLTVVISPLQSLMKDQVDNLAEKGIVDAVTVNGLLSPIERAEGLERVANGMASLLYISPEQLRSKTIEKLLLSRHISRFVIDEAHCFSAWGQDFRVDYLYISDFIKELQQKKGNSNIIPVSCFTATAKQKVISDIKDYFKEKLDLELELFATTSERENLKYAVLFKETPEEKYNTLRALIEERDCPTIVYVARTKTTFQLSEKLTRDGFLAKPYNGKMDSNEKIANQEAFIKNEVKVIVATSAFGMGVDKKDVKLVIHYDISDSLENYVQEAGRAGRDQSLQAECYVLFNDNDLDKHFNLLNQTKLSLSEIQQVWKAIKDLTKTRNTIFCSPLEIARQAGWDDSATSDIETHVKTAILALESAGYIRRGKNSPHVYATGILAKNMEQASEMINNSSIFSTEQKKDAIRIIKSLISSRSIAKAGNDEAESRIDFLADTLGICKKNVISAVNQMKQIGLLEDFKDMSAYIKASENRNKSLIIFERFAKLELFLINQLSDDGLKIGVKELNELALTEGLNFSNVKNIRTILYYWTIKGYILKGTNKSDKKIEIVPLTDIDTLRSNIERKNDICRFAVTQLYNTAKSNINIDNENVPVEFSLIELWVAYKNTLSDTKIAETITHNSIEDALLFLSKINSLNLEGGFLVIYNTMEIQRVILDNKIRYKVDDYKKLNDFYKQKIQQIHIVGEYANLMVRDYNAALQYVQDYFQMNYKKFIEKYFHGNRTNEINRNVTPKKYKQLFSQLSEIQSTIINDDQSKAIVVAAGPGSGKTRVLVHKLASLLLMEDVKSEQLLMLTFSRAAATEFKMRLIELIGNAAYFVEIKTFHSYCFDLLGKVGKIGNSDEMNAVVKNATQMIMDNEIEIGKITKTVLVIDEAQDMDESEFKLIQALMLRNEDLRVIAVGDDDQNIYEFRGSDSKYFQAIINDYNATKFEMTENFRSASNIVELSNYFVKTISNRMKNSECVPVENNNGIVEIVKHTSRYLEEAVVNQIIKNNSVGQTCVLTTTNSEALGVLGLLNKYGMRAKLIQSNKNFQIYNLAEMRCFFKYIDSKLNSPKISDELWNEAKINLKENYSKSVCFDICLNIISTFENINQNKYRTDFEEFVKESNLEDFYNDDKQTIIVSTIHKAKGREFDNVYMLIGNFKTYSDPEKRQLYVGMTRAKKELYIHYKSNYFDNISCNNFKVFTDNNSYKEPDEMILQLSHYDVYLDYFKEKEATVSQLKSGDKLTISNSYFSANINNKNESVCKISSACYKTFSSLLEKGYKPYKAYVRFVVYWKNDLMEKEIPIILPDVHFKKIK